MDIRMLLALSSRRYSPVKYSGSSFKILLSIVCFLYSIGAHAITFNVPTSDTDGTFVISWGNPGAYMELYERPGTSGTWVNIFGYGAAAYSLTLTRTQGTYQYYVRHCHYTSSYPTCANTVTKTIVITLPVPSTPGSLSFQNINSGGDSDGSYRVTWNAANGATRYEWQEKKDSGSWSSPSSTGTALYVDRSGRTNGVWSYQVRACNNAGCSNYSAAVSIKVALTPGVPTSINPLPQSDGSINVNWGASSGAVTAYDLDYKKNNGSFVNGYDGLSVSTLLPQMAIGSYVFQVRACNTVSGFSSCSAWRVSSTVTQTIGVIKYEYDELGRLVRVVDAERRQTEYEQDKADNRTKKTVTQLP